MTYMLSHKVAAVIAALSMLTLASCGAAGTKPDDMTVDAHRAHAASAGAAAAKHGEKYDSKARTADPVAVSSDVTGGVVEWPVTNYNPTDHHLVQAQRLNKAAIAHAAAAAALEKFEAGECGKFPSTTRAMCPLRGPISYWEPLANGVRLHVREGVAMAAVAAHTRCHFAFGRAHGRTGMPDCPIYVGDLEIKVDAGARTLDLTATATGAAAELQRRAATHAVRKGTTTQHSHSKHHHAH